MPLTRVIGSYGQKRPIITAHKYCLKYYPNGRIFLFSYSAYIGLMMTESSFKFKVIGAFVLPNYERKNNFANFLLQGAVMCNG